MEQRIKYYPSFLDKERSRMWKISCDHWKARDLLARAELLADILYQHPHIVGVALTGSVARMERHCHDLDFIVFHDSDPSLSDGSAGLPPLPPTVAYSTPATVFSLMRRRDLQEYLDIARGPVPVNIIAVRDTVLSNCGYLNRLADENSPDFFKTVFCEIPLLLLLPQKSRGITQYGVHPDRHATREFFYDDSGYMVFYRSIRHKCATGCKPSRPWSERSKLVKARKVPCAVRRPLLTHKAPSRRRFT